MSLSPSAHQLWSWTEAVMLASSEHDVHVKPVADTYGQGLLNVPDVSWCKQMSYSKAPPNEGRLRLRRSGQQTLPRACCLARSSSVVASAESVIGSPRTLRGTWLCVVSVGRKHEEPRGRGGWATYSSHHGASGVWGADVDEVPPRVRNGGAYSSDRRVPREGRGGQCQVGLENNGASNMICPVHGCSAA